MSDNSFTITDDGLLVAKDFVAAAMCAHIKDDTLDMMLLHSLRPAAAAATITSNEMRAAPTFVTEARVADGSARTVIANSGNANAATGPEGMVAAERMADIAAEVTGVAASEALVCSTGRIGGQLPMDKIEAAIPTLAEALSRDSAHEAARAIMTTDTVPKEVSVTFEVGGVTVGLGGICKGAGMICPNMATMLCFIATDLAIAPALLDEALEASVARSFNCISVDGDMSTNDTVIILANGAAGNETIASADDPAYAVFCEALDYCTETLAKKIAADGEGASKFVEVRVTGASSYADAQAVARHVTRYNLLKTCIWGQDFNWGRIAAAVGAAGVSLDPERVEISLMGIKAFAGGKPVEYSEQEAQAAVQAHEILIEVDLGAGDEQAVNWTCDLSPDYVTLNAT